MDPIQPPEPLVYGKLTILHEQQIYIGQNMVMDYDPMFGRYWIYTYDRTGGMINNPFIGPIASGVIEKGMQITYVADDQVSSNTTQHLHPLVFMAWTV